MTDDSLTVRAQGLDASLKILTKAGANLHGLDSGAVFAANRQMKDAARNLAEQLARTTVVPLVRSGPAAQSTAMAATVRPKTDRMPIVRIGATNPRLSGWRRSANSRRWRGSLAWGIERGQFPGSPDYYRAPRRNSGYVIGANIPLITRRALPLYEEIVYQALVTAGVTSFG